MPSCTVGSGITVANIQRGANHFELVDMNGDTYDISVDGEYELSSVQIF